MYILKTSFHAMFHNCTLIFAGDEKEKILLNNSDSLSSGHVNGGVNGNVNGGV